MHFFTLDPGVSHDRCRLVSSDRPRRWAAREPGHEGRQFEPRHRSDYGRDRSLVGGFLFGLLGLTSTGLVSSLVTATVGAIVVQCLAANQPVFFRRCLVFLRSIVQPSRASLQNGSEFVQRERLRNGLAGLLQSFNRLFDHLAQFDEHLRGIVAVGSAIHQLWTAADEALVFV